MERIILTILAYKNRHRKKYRVIVASIAIFLYLFSKNVLKMDVDFLFLAWWLYFLQSIKW